MAGNDPTLEKTLEELPVATYRAGETILSDGTKTGRLFILKTGAVVVLKDSVEIARVEQPGAVLGELSALLDQPHSATVQALEASQCYVAEVSLLRTDPIALFHVATVLSRRLIAANQGLLELKKQLQAGESPSLLRRTLAKIEEIYMVGGASYET